MKMALKNGVPEDQRIRFNFTQKEYKALIWIKSNEFVLKGNYFDVITTDFSDGLFTLDCISDQQETVLFKDLNKQVNKNLGDNDLPHNKIKKMNQSFMELENTSFDLGYSQMNRLGLAFSPDFQLSKGHLKLDDHPPTV